MKAACFIPIKENSERVVGKNFRSLNGKKLYEYIVEHAIAANVFDEIFIDSNSEELFDYCERMQLRFIQRKPELALNIANGNDLLNYHHDLHPNFDLYFQLFATAPYLLPKSIRICVEMLGNTTEYDSCFTAVRHQSFFWKNGTPVNYRPCILPRSQDMEPVIEETTGLYGMKKAAIEKYRCRVGAKPYICIVDKFEAVDINTEEDLKLAEYIGKMYWGYGIANG